MNTCNGCSKKYCSLCIKDIPKCPQQCHVYACCGFQECSKCKKNGCKKIHTQDCQNCKKPICDSENCSKYCSGSRWGWNSCKKLTCLDCAKIIKKCSSCSKLQCHDIINDCSHCTNAICGSCKRTCHDCKKNFCRSAPMTLSDNDHYCPDCAKVANLLEDRYKDFIMHIQNGIKEVNYQCSGYINQLPLIKIKDWVLSYPCTDIVCKKLKEFCQISPVGIGEKTVIEEKIRKGLEVKNQDVKLSPEFLEIINGEISKKINTLLCPDEKSISIEFYKLLLYEKGSFFKAHKDTQRSQNHFGSLVVFLPCFYQGGDFLIEHLGEKKQFNFALTPKNFEKNLELKWVAFFTDIQHEILELTDGHRVALTFNIYSSGAKIEPPQSKPEITPSILLKRIFDHPKFEHEKLGYILHHHYTPSTLNPKFLKGIDNKIYSMIKGCEKYSIKIEELDIHASGSGDGGYEYGGYSSSLSYDLADFEFECKTDDVYFLNENDFPFPKFFKGKRPVDQEVEATGNEGTNVELQYQHAYLEIAKKDGDDEEEEEGEEGEDDEKDIVSLPSKRERDEESGDVIEISDEEDHKKQKLE